MSICVVRNAHAADEAREEVGWPVRRMGREGNDEARLQWGREKEGRERGRGMNPSFPPFFLSFCLRFEKICAQSLTATVVTRIPKTVASSHKESARSTRAHVIGCG